MVDKVHRCISDDSSNLSLLAKAYQVDIREAKAVEHAIEIAVKDFNGRLDVFVANAGIPWTDGPAIDGPIQDYKDVVGVDLDSVFYCGRYAATYWRRQKEEGTDCYGNKLDNFGYGSFVATASMSGHIVNFPQMQATYNVAKAGVIHLCRFFFFFFLPYYDSLHLLNFEILM